MEVTKESNIDSILLERFEQEIWNKIPHLEDGKVINATPLIDLTSDFKECAKNLYKLDISDLDLKVYGKFDANLVSGSIKIRPAFFPYFWFIYLLNPPDVPPVPKEQIIL